MPTSCNYKHADEISIAACFDYEIEADGKFKTIYKENTYKTHTQGYNNLLLRDAFDFKSFIRIV